MPKPNKRLGVLKTHKLFIGGKFPRSESGRSLSAVSAKTSEPLANFSFASRKDFRDAVSAARKAGGKWSAASPYLRGQILYRAAEMLESRADELGREIRRATGGPASAAASEVTAAIDCLVYYAGWTDKFAQVFGSTNPVASSHFNFTTPEPTGVVTLLCPDSPALLPMVALIAPVILTGNTAVVIASDTLPLPAIPFAEILATSDLPAGVVNILTGRRAELVSHIAGHMDVNAIIDAGPDSAQSTELEAGSAANLKRYARRNLRPADWRTDRAKDPYWIADTMEQKTTWHPIGA